MFANFMRNAPYWSPFERFHSLVILQLSSGETLSEHGLEAIDEIRKMKYVTTVSTSNFDKVHPGGVISYPFEALSFHGFVHWPAKGFNA